MGKKIGVFLESEYEDIELWYPLLRMKEEGHDVCTISPIQGKIYMSKHGYPCTADKSLDQVKPKDLDGILIPGGFSPDFMRRDKRFAPFVAEMVKSGKLVGAICHGPWMLCSAKCIKGRKVTCFCTVVDDIENAGGIFEDSPVVVDGNIVTSRLPTDVTHFAKACIEVLNKQK